MREELRSTLTTRVGEWCVVMVGEQGTQIKVKNRLLKSFQL